MEEISRNARIPYWMQQINLETRLLMNDTRGRNRGFLGYTGRVSAVREQCILSYQESRHLSMFAAGIAAVNETCDTAGISHLRPNYGAHQSADIAMADRE